MGKGGNPMCNMMEIMVKMNKEYSGRIGLNISIHTHHMHMVYLLSDRFIIGN